MSIDSRKAPETEDSEVRELTRGIERIRSEMSATIQQLEHRLSPAELGEQAKAQIDQLEARVRVLVKDGLGETRDVLQEQIQAAKGALKEELEDAKEKVTQGLSEARETIKKDIQTAIVGTKQAVREATIGQVENLATKAGDVMNDTRDTLIETIRQNPIPAAFVGIGLAWMLMNRSSASRRRMQPERGHAGSEPRYRGSSSHDDEGFVEHAAHEIARRAGDAMHQVGSAIGSAGEAVSGAAHQASAGVGGALQHGAQAASHLVEQTTDTARNLAHDVSDKTGHIVQGATETAGQLAHQAKDLATHAAHTARDQAVRVERGVESTYDADPLVLGAVALAAGAAVGYALPRTQKEDRLLGAVRDRLLHGATDVAREATQSLHRLADDAGQTAREALTSASTTK